MCSVHFSAAFRWRTRKASSRAPRVSFQDGCGSYFPGSTGIKSLICLPNTHMAGDTFVVGSGVLRCWRIARWKVSVSRFPLGSVLDMMSRLADLTPISARQLEWGNATDDFLWCTPQSRRNFWLALATNSGPPSDDSSSGMPKVENVRRKQVISPLDPSFPRSTVSQLE